MNSDDDDDNENADRSAPPSDAAMERIRMRMSPYLEPGPSIVDDIIAERLAGAKRDDAERPSGSPHSYNALPRRCLPKPLKKAVLKPDLVAEHKREWTQTCVDVLRADLLQFGIEASDDVIFGAWERHSDSHAAGWLSLYGDAEANVRALVQHFDIE